VSDFLRNADLETVLLIVGMVVIGLCIGLGKVSKETSYGLDIVLLGLANALNNKTKGSKAEPLKNG
jgi:hypothetical protein